MDDSKEILSVDYFLNIIGNADSEESLRKEIAKPVSELINNKRFSILKYTEKVNSFFVGNNESGGFFNDLEKIRRSVIEEDVADDFLNKKKRLFVFSPSAKSVRESLEKLRQSFDKTVKNFLQIERKIKKSADHFPDKEKLESLSFVPSAYEAIQQSLKEFDIESMNETDQVKLRISMNEIEKQLIKLNKLEEYLKETFALFDFLKTKNLGLENEIAAFRENELMELEYCISSFKDNERTDSVRTSIELVMRSHSALNDLFYEFETILFSFASDATKKEYQLHELGKN